MSVHDQRAGQPAIHFTLDGTDYTSDERRKTAAELLNLAGLNPADHDLARVVGQGQVEKRLRDEEVVQLTPGARFVSIFTGATPVV